MRHCLSLDKGGSDVTAKLYDVIAEKLGHDSIEAFKAANRTAWQHVYYAIDNVKNVTDSDHSELELGALGFWLQQRNNFPRNESSRFISIGDGFRFELDRNRNIAKLLIPQKVTHEAYGVVTEANRFKDMVRLIKTSKAKFVFLVGGFAESKLLQNALKGGNKNKVFIIPNPSAAYPMKGAALKGFQ